MWSREEEKRWNNSGEEPEAEPAAIAERTDEGDQTDSMFTGFGLQEAMARGLIDPALLGLGDAETQDELTE